MMKYKQKCIRCKTYFLVEQGRGNKKMCDECKQKEIAHVKKQD